jgi:hypothetical protein
MAMSSKAMMMYKAVTILRGMGHSPMVLGRR